MKIDILNVYLNDLHTYGFKVFELIGGRCLFGITLHYVETHLDLEIFFIGINCDYGNSIKKD